MNVPDPTIFNLNGTGRPRVRAGSGFNIVYHGMMAQRLGVDLLIRAAANLRDRIPGLRLHLWGRGDDLSSFVALAQQLGVDGHVDFNPTGYDLRELPEQLRVMDLGVVGNRRSPATNLMLPVKLMEYVSLGIPAVVPRLPTIAHYFSNDMVAFYEPENVASLADAIFELYCAPDRRLRQAERAIDFLSQYGWERQGPELVSFYRQLVEN
jgi:glycosyltransferase involved in cell wall biosynthesis